MDKLKILALAALSLLALSCSGGKEEAEKNKVKEPTILTTSVLHTTFSPEANTAKIIVTCDAPWTITTNESWITLSPDSGDGTAAAITVKATMIINRESVARTATLSLQSGSKSAVVKLTQNPLTDMFPATEVNLVKKEITNFRIITEKEWTASIPADAQEWLKIEPKSGKGDVYMSIQANDENENVGDRKTAITFTMGDETIDVPVTQRQKDVILFGDSQVAVDYQAGTLEVSTNTNVNFTVTVTDGSDWLHYVETKALNAMKSTFRVDQNSGIAPRFGKVSFTYGTELTEVLTVVQGPLSTVTTKTLPGLYMKSGSEITYNAGVDQLSVRKSGDQFSFRLLNPVDIKVVEISGIPVDASANTAVNIELRVLEGKQTVSQTTDTAFILKADDNYLWLALSDGSGAVVKK